MLRLLLYLRLIFLSLLVSSCQKKISLNTYVETEPAVLKANPVKINNSIGGYYSGLPARYGETSKTYPLLIFLPGEGQLGNGSTELSYVLYDGVPELMKYKQFPPSFKSKGSYFSFIVLAPQFSHFPTIEEVKEFIDYGESHYRVDKKRIYVAGFSDGGILTAEIGAKYTSEIAAIVPIAGVAAKPVADMESKCRNIAAGKLPVWVFQNDGDMIANVDVAKRYISLINSSNPAIPPKYTQFSPTGWSNHNAWSLSTSPTYAEGGMNIYEWMLQYSR